MDGPIKNTCIQEELRNLCTEDGTIVKSDLEQVFVKLGLGEAKVDMLLKEIGDGPSISVESLVSFLDAGAPEEPQTEAPPDLMREKSVYADVRRTDLNIDVNDPFATFQHWDKNKNGKIEYGDLREFVNALAGMAFNDGLDHSGWSYFQLASIRAKYCAEKDYLTEEEFSEVLETVGSMTLWNSQLQDQKEVCVIGAGAFGTAMAVALGFASHNVRLLMTSGRKPIEKLEEEAKEINEKRTFLDPKILAQLPPDFKLPQNVNLYGRPEDALRGVQYLVSAMPVQSSYSGLVAMKEYIPPDIPIITVSKGICSNKYAGMSPDKAAAKIKSGEVKEEDLERDPTYLMTMDEVIELALGEDTHPIVALAGPSFAKMVCQGEPTAATVACNDEAVAREVALLFSTPLFKCFYTTDITGAELSGALKNVVAICCGMCIGCPKYNLPPDLAKELGQDAIDAALHKAYRKSKGGAGLGMGPNVTNFLLTRAWEDVRRVCARKGACDETLLSLSGLGDLMMTCFGGESRNAKFGGILGSAVMSDSSEPPSQDNPTVDFVLSHPEIYPVCEGYWTAKALKDFAKELDIELTVLGRMCDVLNGDLDPRDLVSTIMTQPVQPEFDGSVRAYKAVAPMPARPMAFPPVLAPRKHRRRHLLDSLMDRKKDKQPGEVKSLDPNSTAVLMIEFQNEFTTEGGKMAEHTKDVMEATGMLAKAKTVCDAARAKGVKVVHAPILFEDTHEDNPNRGFGILQSCKDGELFTAETWNADYHESMKPKEGDLIVDGKRGLDAFPNSNLQHLLNVHGVTNLAICGFLTSCCVESTMRTAYEKGYNVMTLTDCCADTSMDAHKAAVEGTFKLFSQPMTADDFMKSCLS